MYPVIHEYQYSDVFRFVNQLEVWSWILNRRVSLGEKFNSPFRYDAKPGCFLREYNGVILFTDFANMEYNTFTCVHAVAHINHLNLNEAASMICNKFILSYDGYFSNANYMESKNEKHKSKAQITFKPFTYNSKPTFTDLDAAYWKPRGVTSQDLKDMYVYSVEYLHINGGYVKPEYPCYGFYFPESGNVKIYQPNSVKQKWLSTTTINDVWHWLSDSSTAIITKSFKDGMMLHKLFPDVDIFAFQSEVIIPKTHIEHIDALYEKVIILYDNDSTGIYNSSVLEDMFQRTYAQSVFYPIEYGKDTDEVLLNKGKEFVINYLQSFLS